MKLLLKNLRALFYWINVPRYLFLIAVSTLAHILFVLTYESHAGVDGVIYQRVARLILESNTWSGCGAFEGAYWPPLFCYYLAVFWKLFGDLPWLFYSLNVVIALATTLVSTVYLRRIFSEPIAFWSTLLFYNSMIIYYFTMYYKYELLAVLFVAGFLSLVLSEKPSYRKLFIGGLLLGLGALATGRVLTLLPAALYYLYYEYSQQTRLAFLIRGTVLAVGLVLAISPWVLRNYHCLERFVPLTTNSAVNFYMGFNERAHGGLMYMQNFPAPYNTIDKDDNSAFYKGGVDFILAHPGAALKLMLIKLNLMWRIHYADMALIYPFFYIGIFLMVRRRWTTDNHSGRFVQIALLLYSLIHLLFISRYYYVIPVLPLVYGTAISTQKAFFGSIASKRLIR